MFNVEKQELFVCVCLVAVVGWESKICSDVAVCLIVG